MSKTGNINMDDDMRLTVSSTTKVTCNDKIIMFFPGGEKEELNVKIEADFKDLKPEHHQIFLQSFSSKYNHHTQIFNTHTNHNGSKVPTMVGKAVERKSLWNHIKELFNPKQR
tara:strand:+ start:418 stop:756 length:339 start_codon:yes stop_codon:yes gene_type:complete